MPDIMLVERSKYLSHDPHELTQEVFVHLATITALSNHGRKWQVALGSNSAFSDEEKSYAALIDVHRAL
ncbi:hypothetical protein ACFQDN_22240 [Pseudomonas asuensis]